VTEKCDVYSFGVLALEVIQGKHPGEHIVDLINGVSEIQQLIKDFVDPRLAYPTQQSESVLVSIIDLAKSCLDPNPQSRPTMSNISKVLSRALNSM
jgi:serine/threonine protein kinase